MAKKAVIVEEHKDLRRIFRKALQPNLEVRAFAAGASALAYLARTQVDLVLWDLTAGATLADVRAVAPRTAVWVITDYPGQEFIEGGWQDKDVLVLVKLVSFRQLRELGELFAAAP